LRWNLVSNLCRNVVVRCEAVGKAPERDHVFYAVVGTETGGNSLRPPAPDMATGTTEQKVALVSVDHFCREQGIKQVHFIKLDVEGGELDVLHGASGLLSSCPRPTILLEVSDVRTAPWGYAAREIVDQLIGRDYQLFEIGDGILTRHTVQQTYHKDLVAVPAEAVQTLVSKMTARGWKVMEEPLMAASPG
jgi:FkbM family methyltransferase